MDTLIERLPLILAGVALVVALYAAWSGPHHARRAEDAARKATTAAARSEAAALRAQAAAKKAAAAAERTEAAAATAAAARDAVIVRANQHLGR